MPETETSHSLSRPFHYRNFRLLWFGQGVSSLGKAMYRVTLGWSIYMLTGSTADMGLTLAANVIPQLILTLYGGVLSDRMSRRNMILVCDCAAAVVTGLLAFVSLAGISSITELVAASFLLGIISSFFGPAYRPLLRNLLPVEEQQVVTAVTSATRNVITVVGPLLASLIFTLGSAAIGFAVDAGTFVFSAFCTVLLAVPAGKVKFPGSIQQDLRNGLHMVMRTRWIRITILLSAIANLLCVSPLYVLLPSVVARSGGDSKMLGIVTAVQATSTAVFALAVGKYGHRLPRGVTIYVLVMVTGLGIALLGAGISWHWLIPLSMVVIGMGFAFNVTESAMYQQLVPRNYLSRVFSVNIVSSFAFAPVGYVGAGVLARSIGDSAVLVGGGSVLAACALLCGILTRWELSGEVVVPSGEVELVS